MQIFVLDVLHIRGRYQNGDYDRGRLENSIFALELDVLDSTSRYKNGHEEGDGGVDLCPGVADMHLLGPQNIRVIRPITTEAVISDA